MFAFVYDPDQQDDNGEVVIKARFLCDTCHKPFTEDNKAFCLYPRSFPNPARRDKRQFHMISMAHAGQCQKMFEQQNGYKESLKWIDLDKLLPQLVLLRNRE